MNYKQILQGIITVFLFLIIKLEQAAIVFFILKFFFGITSMYISAGIVIGYFLFRMIDLYYKGGKVDFDEMKFEDLFTSMVSFFFIFCLIGTFYSIIHFLDIVL